MEANRVKIWGLRGANSDYLRHESYKFAPISDKNRLIGGNLKFPFASVLILQGALKPVAIIMEEFWPRLHPNLKIPENKGLNHGYDCALLNFYHYFLELSEQDKINTIRAPFQEGSPIAGHGCSFRDKNHIQWAVRTPAESILGYFVPRGDGTEQPELMTELTSSYQ